MTCSSGTGRFRVFVYNLKDQLVLLCRLQGKRISGVEGDQVSDVCHENAMLKTENDK